MCGTLSTKAGAEAKFERWATRAQPLLRNTECMSTAPRPGSQKNLTIHEGSPMPLRMALYDSSSQVGRFCALPVFAEPEAGGEKNR